MCCSDDVSFTIYYGGKFNTMADGTIVYNGGSGHELVTQARSLFQGLPVSLYGQRVWYKLPFEDLKELRILCEGIDNFERMCDAAKWTRVVEIYMEKDEDYEGDHGNEEGRNDDQIDFRRMTIGFVVAGGSEITNYFCCWRWL